MKIFPYIIELNALRPEFLRPTKFFLEERPYTNQHYINFKEFERVTLKPIYLIVTLIIHRFRIYRYVSSVVYIIPILALSGRRPLPRIIHIF